MRRSRVRDTDRLGAGEDGRAAHALEERIAEHTVRLGRSVEILDTCIEALGLDETRRNRGLANGASASTAALRFDDPDGQGGQPGNGRLHGQHPLGLPTHAIALMSDFFNGTGYVLSRLLAARRFEAIPQLLSATVKGFTRGVDSAGYIMRTG